VIAAGEIIASGGESGAVLIARRGGKHRRPRVWLERRKLRIGWRGVFEASGDGNEEAGACGVIWPMLVGNEGATLLAFKVGLFLEI